MEADERYSNYDEVPPRQLIIQFSALEVTSSFWRIKERVLLAVAHAKVS